MVSISNIAGTILLLVLCFKYASRVPPISVEFWGHACRMAELSPTLCLDTKAKENTSSIFCYDCNSAYDPRCGEEFDSFSLGIVNCSLRDPPEHINPVEPTFCRVIKMEIYGKVRIVRQCGFIEEEVGGHTCRRQTGNGDLFITYCTCDTDLCNTASALDYKLALLLTIAAMSFRVL